MTTTPATPPPSTIEQRIAEAERSGNWERSRRLKARIAFGRRPDRPEAA